MRCTSSVASWTLSPINCTKSGRISSFTSATVSTPVSWKEIEHGIRIEDFTVKNVPRRVARLGDLWKPLLSARGRFDLSSYV